MKLLLTAKNNIGSWFIRVFTWSRWSHIAIVVDGYVIEASALHGVCFTPLEQALNGTTDHAFIEVPCSNPDAVIQAALSQADKPYDWGAIFGFGFRRDWQDDKKWFCSELPAWAFEQAGCPVFRSEAMHRVLPEHWWMLAPQGEAK